MRVFALIVSLLAGCAWLAFGAGEAHVTILATTDTHGYIYPWDYLSGKPAQRGLAKIATLIAAERKTTPDALLVDAGDTIQGSSLEGVYQAEEAGQQLKSDPMMLVMNHLRYD